MPPHPPLQATFLPSILSPKVTCGHWAALGGVGIHFRSGCNHEMLLSVRNCGSLGSAPQMHPLRPSGAPLHLWPPARCLLSVQHAFGQGVGGRVGACRSGSLAEKPVAEVLSSPQFSAFPSLSRPGTYRKYFSSTQGQSGRDLELLSEHSSLGVCVLP